MRRISNPPRGLTWPQRIACFSVVALLAVSCLSEQTQKQLDAQQAALAAAQASEKSARDQLAAAIAAGQKDTQALADQVAAAVASSTAAKADLEKLKTEAKKEQIGTGVATTQQALQGVSPLIGALLPGAGGILNILSTALGGLAAAFPRKEPA